MPEAMECRESFHIGTPLEVGPCVLLTIERRLRLVSGRADRPWLAYELQPHALVVRDASGLHAIGTDGLPLPLARLCEQLPGLGRMLDSL